MTTPTVIITGASRGLGAAAARLTAAMGANVVLTARSAADLEEVAQGIGSDNGRTLVIPADVSRLEDCRRIVEQTVHKWGRIDALVNNAGVLDPVAPLAEADPAAWRQNLIVNVVGPMMLTQLALPYLRQSHGRVINVSSGAAVGAVAGWSAYCAAKAGLNQLNAVLAKEEANVTAVAFRPGVVDTEMQAVIRREGEKGMPAAEHGRFMSYYTEGELLPPEQPGRALAVLALYAPHEWSGSFLSWNEEKVQAVVDQYS